MVENKAEETKQPEETKVEETKQPVWLGDLIQAGFYDKVVLIGFPYDEGAKKAGNRKGADYGPGKLIRKSVAKIACL